VEWVALTPHWLQASPRATAMGPDPQRSPSDASVRQAIDAARAEGLRVFLKPQLDLTDDGWRGEIAFETEAAWARWFASYRGFLGHYARLAAQARVALFSVGVELDGTRHRSRDWRQVIEEVRVLYEGPLVYAANWGRERDIDWWGDLDYAGVDVYFPVARGASPSRRELEERWSRELHGLRGWAERTGRPVLVTEIGYRSLEGAGAEPWDWRRGGAPALREQAVLWQAALSALWPEPWLAGIYGWQWRTAPPADPAADTGYTPQGKPAWDVIRAFYARERGPRRHCDPATPDVPAGAERPPAPW
jgi:hypothetical protein